MGLLKGLSRSRSRLFALPFGPRDPLSEEPPPDARRERLCGVNDLSSALLRDCAAESVQSGWYGTGQTSGWVGD